MQLTTNATRFAGSMKVTQLNKTDLNIKQDDPLRQAVEAHLPRVDKDARNYHIDFTAPLSMLQTYTATIKVPGKEPFSLHYRGSLFKMFESANGFVKRAIRQAQKATPLPSRDSK